MIPLRNLGRVGVVSDTPPFDLPPNIFTAASNVGFRHGAARKMGGLSTVDLGTPALEADQRSFITWTNGGVVRTAFGHADGIQVYNGTALVAATFEDAGASPYVLSTGLTNWQFEIFGELLLANNGIDPPFWSDDGVVFAILPDWEANFGPGAVCQFLRVYKEILIAGGINNDALLLAWSDITDGAVSPRLPTSWTVAPTTSAGQQYLIGADGPLVDGGVLGDAFIVYQRDAATRVNFVEDERVLYFERFLDYGLIARSGFINFGAFHFVIGPETAYVHAGTQQVDWVLDNKIEQQFYAELADPDSVFVARNYRHHEAMVFYRAGDDTGRRRCLVWSYNEQTTTFMDYPEDVAWVTNSTQPPPLLVWDDLTAPWASYTETWSELLGGKTRRQLYMLTTAGEWKAMGTSAQRDGAEYLAWVERQFFDLSEALENPSQIRFVSAAYPRVSGVGAVDIQFGYSMAPGDVPTWLSPVRFTIGVDHKVDVRVTGRYLHWRFGSWTGEPLAGQWSLTGIDLDVIADSGR
jgi:hypothetical protein